MAAAKPFKLSGGSSTGIVRRSDGRFDLEDPSRAVPTNPLEQEAEGGKPDRWAPGIGQCTDPTSGQRQLWKELRPRDGSGVVLAFRARIALDGDTYAYSCYRILSELYVVDGLR